MINLKMPISVGTVVLAIGIYLLTYWLAKRAISPPSPILVDTLIYDFSNGETPLTSVGEKWYLAKPLNDDSKYKALWTRIYHARLVFQGKATAYQYYEDQQVK